MGIDIGPKFYTGPSTYNNDDSFLQTDWSISITYISSDDRYRSNFYTGPYLQPNGDIFKVSLFLKQLINSNHIYYFLVWW